MIMEKATAKKQKSSQLVPRESEQDEPGVPKKPALKQEAMDLVPAENLQGKIERLKNSTKGLELEETEKQFKDFFESLDNKERPAVS